MSWKDRLDDDLKKPRKGGSWKLKEDDNEIRVLPTKRKKKDKEPYIYFTHQIHTNVGPDKRVVTCGKDSSGNGHCWLCDKQIPKDEASDSKSKQKRAETMKAKEVFTIQIAVLDGKKLRGPEVFSMNLGGKKSLAYKIMKTIRNPKYDTLSTSKGRNIIINREGQGMATVYSSPMISPDKSEVPEKILKAMRTFDEIIPKYDENRQKQAYSGRSDSASSSSSNQSSENGDSSMAAKKKSKKAVASSSVSSAASSSATSSAASSSATSSAASSSVASSSSDKATSSSGGSSAASSSAKSSSAKSSAASSSAASSSAASSAVSSAASSAASDTDDTPKKGKKGKAGAKKGPKAKGKKKK